MDVERLRAALVGKLSFEADAKYGDVRDSICLEWEDQFSR
jgi:hypothetical protein